MSIEDIKKLANETVQVHDVECELYVLGTAMSKVDALAEIREFVDEDSFYISKHKAIWKAMVSLEDNGEHVDMITTLGELHAIGYTEITPFEIATIAGKTVIGSAVPHAMRLRDLHIRRQLWVIGHKLVGVGSTEVEDVEEARDNLKEQIDSLFDKSEDHIFTIDDSVKELYEQIKLNMSGYGNITGTSTGFKKLDEKGGLHPSDLVIVAGESSQGKTSLANAMVLNALQSGAKVAFYSMEMTRVQLTARFAAMMTGVSSSDLLYSSSLTPFQLEQFDRSVSELSRYNLYFDDKSTSNIEGILASIRSLKRKYDIDGVVVDYLQILNVNSKNNNKEQAMADAARRLKNIAKDLNIWVIALSQLNRDSQNPVPNLNRLRDSGQIAEAADMVMFIYRPEYYGRSFPEPFENEDVTGKAIIDVAKGRNIGTMRFLARFDARLTLFTDIVEGESLYDIQDDRPF